MLSTSPSPFNNLLHLVSTSKYGRNEKFHPDFKAAHLTVLMYLEDKGWTLKVIAYKDLSIAI